MADAAVTFLLDNLTQVIQQEADRLGRVWVEIRGIEEELEFMASLLERSEALDQIPDNETVKKIKTYINKAETLIEGYTTIASESATGVFLKLVTYAIRQWRSKRKLKEFMVEVRKFTSTLKEYDKQLRDERLVGNDDQRQVPRYLWRFIYYFLLFPAKTPIPARRLIVLWVAEGLIRKSTDDDKSIEDIAEQDLNELIERGLISVTKYKLNGKVRACFLEDGIRDEWMTRAKKANFFQSKKNRVRRLVDQTAIGDADSASSFVQIHGKPSIFSTVRTYGDVISFMSFDTQEGSKPGEDIGDFLHKCIEAERFLWLRMLDLEKVFRPKLPETLGKLVRLKYLGLRWTYLQHLPHFVNKLLQLQVLDVKHTYISVLPSSIWKMMDLRHLYLSEAYHTKFPHRPSGGVSLTDLQTLWGAFIDEETHVEEGLDTLEGIRKLGLSCQPSLSTEESDMSKQLKAVDKWVSKLGKLDNLRLKSRDEEGNAADLHLTTLEKNKKLSTVYLLGRLNLDVVDKFPHSLTDIILSGSQLNVDPMKYLEKLPNLKILRLLAKSVLHPTLHCSKGRFPNLKVFYIWCLEDLEEWLVEEESMPCLEEFEIRSCPKLKKLPHQLQYIEKLRKFRLTKMPESFMEEEKTRQPQLWAKIEQVNVKMNNTNSHN